MTIKPHPIWDFFIFFGSVSFSKSVRLFIRRILCEDHQTLPYLGNFLDGLIESVRLLWGILNGSISRVGLTWEASCFVNFFALFLTLARLFWNTIIACCSCRISRYHVRDDSMENCKEYCDVKATVYVIPFLTLMLTPASPPFQVRLVFFWSSEEIGNNIDIVLNSNKDITRPGLDVKLPIKLTLIINSFVLWKIYVRQYQCYF